MMTTAIHAWDDKVTEVHKIYTKAKNQGRIKKEVYPHEEGMKKVNAWGNACHRNP